MSDKGWVAIDRQIQENPIWIEDSPFCRRAAWIDLILMANHSDNTVIMNGNPVIVNRGQFITSEKKLAAKWNWSRDKVHRFILLLVELGMIHKESTSRYTIVTLINYSKFQNMRTTNKATDKASHKATNKATDKAQTTMNNNDNNEEQIEQLSYEELNKRVGDDW